ncbi:MAG: hypothetical protein ITG01_11700 [Comamonas sp.]|nr:hypothetical protein [Comamonas sp.]
MRILLPTEITAQMIASGTNIPELDTNETAWAPSGAFAIDDLRVYSGRIYSCVKAYTANANSKPPDKDTEHWLFKEPTNRMSPFDEYLFTKARRIGSLTYVLKPGFITGFAAYGVDAGAFDFEYRHQSGGEVLLQRSGTMWEQAYGHWELLFGNLQRTDRFASPELPLRPAGELTMTFSHADPDAEVSVGWMGVGQWRTLFAPGLKTGGTEMGIEVTPKSYARFTRPSVQDGTYKRIPGRRAKVVQGSVVIDSKDAPMVDDWMNQVLDVPCAVDFSSLPRYRHLSGVGFLKGTLRTDSWKVTRLNFTFESNV